MSLSAFLLNQKRCARKQDLLDEAQQKGIKNVSKRVINMHVPHFIVGL